ncbi:transcription factor SPEECHLESS-like isoform X2 [Larimichthys crocea]|uniref:transcription factor SPEECHLESS-like isoform X2 n=1 Tax=Larimichthys crocea TaxID=215358 RepID=UPI000F5E47D2|nr:transcription factor SPEECHLESS-like isoform X2 [Larimichthys crocea]
MNRATLNAPLTFHLKESSSRHIYCLIFTVRHHCITGPEPEPGPGADVDPAEETGSEEADRMEHHFNSGPVGDQILSTIDSDALLTAASPEEEQQEEEEEQEEEDGDKGVMKTSSCVLLERRRRKRITQSCSTLRQLVPTIHGVHVDMVTVLETTVAFLKTVQEVVQAEDPKLQSQESRESGHKMAAKKELTR